MQESQRRRAQVWVLLAVLHLGMVALMLWGVRGPGAGTTLFQVRRTYNRFAGLFRDYAYFSNVGYDTRAGFIVEHAEGSTVYPVTSDHREAAIRIESIVVAAGRHKEMRDLVAQSLASTALATRPDAKSALVFTEARFVPKMADFRAGVRPEWKVTYAGRFEPATKGATP